MSVTVSVLVSPEPGVLCRMLLMLKAGTSTSSGLAPSATPNNVLFGFTIATCAMFATVLPLPSPIMAAILTAGDV